MTARHSTTAGDRLLRIDEVAAHCQVSPKTIRRAIANGSLLAVRAGKQLRITPRELTRYLQRDRARR
jgi:excisionase family DNA binding protein